MRTLKSSNRTWPARSLSLIPGRAAESRQHVPGLDHARWPRSLPLPRKWSRIPTPMPSSNTRISSKSSTRPTTSRCDAGLRSSGTRRASSGPLLDRAREDLRRGRRGTVRRPFPRDGPRLGPVGQDRLQFDKNSRSRSDADALQAVKAQSISLQDMFPLSRGATSSTSSSRTRPPRNSPVSRRSPSFPVAFRRRDGPPELAYGMERTASPGEKVPFAVRRVADPVLIQEEFRLPGHASCHLPGSRPDGCAPDRRPGQVRILQGGQGIHVFREEAQ